MSKGNLLIYQEGILNQTKKKKIQKTTDYR